MKNGWNWGEMHQDDRIWFKGCIGPYLGDRVEICQVIDPDGLNGSFVAFVFKEHYNNDFDYEAKAGIVFNGELLDYSIIGDFYAYPADKWEDMKTLWMEKGKKWAMENYFKAIRRKMKDLRRKNDEILKETQEKLNSIEAEIRTLEKAFMKKENDMKVVDKYGLALEPKGTAFYVLDEWGNVGCGSEKGLCIKEGETRYVGGKPCFIGVAYVQPDKRWEGGKDVYGLSLEDGGSIVPYDTDSATDFADGARFLVLDKDELKAIAGYLQVCLERLPEED